MEEYTPESQEETKSEDLKRWFQDNLRIIISVAIVVVIAGGIYSYSKRGESPVVSDQTSNEQTASTDKSTADVAATADNQAATPATANKQVSSTATSKETETSFVETAGKGGSLTVLARSATADYLEKNPDSSLTKEHKIYIEDFLRKQVGKKSIHAGTSVEFSKDMIQKAVEKSKTLNDRQLKNLQKYSAHVANL